MISVYCVYNRDKVEIIFFFNVHIQKNIWKTVLMGCGIQRKIGNWEQQLNWAVKKMKAKAMLSIVLRLAWSTFLYHVWSERNCRVHKQVLHTKLQVLEKIQWDVGVKASQLKNYSRDPINFLFRMN